MDKPEEEQKYLEVASLTQDIRDSFTVVNLKPRARVHTLYQIALPPDCVHTISKERSVIGPFEYYTCPDGRVIVIDHAWGRVNASLRRKEASHEQNH